MLPVGHNFYLRAAWGMMRACVPSISLKINPFTKESGMSLSETTNEVDWTSLRATTGVGPLGHTACQGLFVHRTLALTPERVPACDLLCHAGQHGHVGRGREHGALQYHHRPL